MAAALSQLHPGNRPLSIDDFALLPNDGHCYEIMGGQLFVTPSPAFIHQWIAMQLGSQLNQYLISRSIVVAVAAPMDVQFSHYDIVEPDLIVALNEQRDSFGTS